MDLPKLATLLGHEAKVHKFQRTEIILSMFSDCDGINLVNNNKNIFNIWKYLEIKQHASK